MYITTRATKLKIIVSIVLIISVILFGGLFAKGQKQTEKAELEKGQTTEQREIFLRKYNIDIDKKSQEQKEVQIPKEFDKIYIPYNRLQISSGFDLSPYKGKKVVVYSYIVTNYPIKSDTVYATLLVYEGKIIGGDIHSLKLDGFMHGLKNIKSAD